MMKVKSYILAAALVFVVGAGYAQGGNELNRQVDVAKDYMPRVNRAAKLGIQPQLADTTTLRPELDYTVRPRAWAGGFEVAPIRAAQMSAGTYNAQYPFYLKVGGGFPGQTILDLYATSSRPGSGSFGVYANHRSQLADIKNYRGVKQDAQSTRNSIGVFGKAVFGRQNRLGISGEVGFDYDVWTNYAIGMYSENSENVPPGYDPQLKYKKMQHYATPRASLVFGNDFTDLSYFNFRLGGDIYHLSDRRDYKETGGKAFLEFGKKFDLHRLVLGGSVDLLNGKETYDGGENKHANSIYRFYADYRLESGNVIFGLGAHFAYDSPGSDSERDGEFVFLPQAELKFALADEFNIYATLASAMNNNSARSVSAKNPYVRYAYMLPDEDFAPERDYSLRAGFSGSVASVFSYNVYAGGGITKNNVTFFLPELYYVAGEHHYIGHQDDFIAVYDEKLKYFAAGAELEARIGGGFSARVAGEFRSYDSDLFDIAGYLPEYTASLGLKYTYRDKFSIRAGVELRGEYDYLRSVWVSANPGNPFTGYYEYRLGDTAPVGVDVSLGADYNISENLGIFIEGYNLANRKLYQYPMLPGVGINISAGVKLRF